jgi:hypothetical protein
MPKMMILTVAASSALAGAALAHLAAGRRITADSVRGLGPYVDQARVFGTAARDAIRSGTWMKPRTPRTTNSAFDQYRAEVLRSLEDEQQEFNAYLQRLRRARDQDEFDAFIADRRLQRSDLQGTAGAPTTSPE